MQKLLFLLTLIWGAFLATAVLGQPSDPLQKYRNLATQGQVDQAVRDLKKQYENQKDPAQKAKLAFALGVMSYKAGQTAPATGYFNESIQLKTRLGDYARFYLGLIERDNQNWDAAKKNFQAVKLQKPPSILIPSADIELARVSKRQKRWTEAFNLLTALERRNRKSHQYSEILYDLTEAGLASGRTYPACRAAVKLYSRFPVLAQQWGWGFDLSKANVSGQPLKCESVLTVKDREKRIRQLLLEGAFDQARAEIKEWTGMIQTSSSPRPEEVGSIEMQEGILDLAEGHLASAIEHFLKAQGIKGHNFTAQMLLAKAYSQSDNYPAAVEAYLNAHNISPRSKMGHKALFQAAFLSYQYRDYDGASRRFEEVARRGRGSVVWDSKWHLAWIRYLKEDYDGALREFDELVKNRYFRNKTSEVEKMKYWQAMSLLRLGRTEEARPIFTELAASTRMSYYSGASLARLRTLPEPAPKVDGPALIAPPDKRFKGHELISPPDRDKQGKKIAPGASPAPATVPPTDQDRGPAEAEENSEDSLAAKKGDKLEDPEAGEDDDAAETAEGGDQIVEEPQLELPAVTSLKDPALAARIERAKDLIGLGFDFWAQLELREIEKRTRNQGYLQTLMIEYKNAGDYFRSAYIADAVFQRERERNGPHGSNLFWVYAFPQAYPRTVISRAGEFGIHPGLAWGIMRAESGFRVDIHSQAGAMGLMQIIPPTAQRVANEIKVSGFKNTDLLDPEINIRFGIAYIARLSRKLGANLPLVIAAYNAGPHRVLGWLKDFGELDLDEFVDHIPYVETRGYVKKVLRNYYIYRTLYDKGQAKSSNPLEWLAKKSTFKFNGPKPAKESWDDKN
jgi:soluble lytic murein transglycosylase